MSDASSFRRSAWECGLRRSAFQSGLTPSVARVGPCEA